MEMANHLIVYL